MTSLPTITVVIPTAGRIALTRACVESIRTTSAAEALAVEIVLVDSSSAEEQMQLQAICTELGARLLPGPRSVSEKRNLGAEQARAKLVMFLDSDCAVAPGCLAAHLATMQDSAVHASQGTTRFRGPERLAFRAVRCSGLLNAFTPSTGQLVRSAASANLMVRREPFLIVRFDPRLGPPGLGGEDVDFGFRFSARGFRIVGTAGALVHHDTATWSSAAANGRRFFSWGRSEVYLIERHPAMSYLDMPSPVAVALLLGMASLPAIAWSPRAALTLPLGFLAYAAFMSAAGARNNPQDRLGGALGHWVFFVLDAGRIWESFRLLRPHAALKRIRFAEDQVTQEWRDLVPASWAVWLMVLAGVVFLWWAVH
jgi:GT2 family glycosyltransferase